MSKRCEDCEYFNGYDYGDGTPCCDYENSSGDTGYEVCPFNDVASLRKNGINIEIDSGFMTDYIKHTIINTVENKACDIANREVAFIIDSTIKEEIRNKVKEKLDEKIEIEINNALDDFMNGEIHTGGLYGDSTVTRKKYIANKIEERLSKIDIYSIKSMVENEASNQIDKFTRNLRNEINQSIKTLFDEATRTTLTDNVVSMLMSNDTYKRLSESMSSLLPSPKG